MAEKTPENTDELGRQTGKDSPYAYTIEDPIFGEFKVLNSANAWWLQREKVVNLISALKIDAPDIEACSYAGISKGQLGYFKEMHLDFSDKIEPLCRAQLRLKARSNIAQKINPPLGKDGKLVAEPDCEYSKWYLEKKARKEFGNNIDVTSDGDKITGIKVEIFEGKKPEPPKEPEKQKEVPEEKLKEVLAPKVEEIKIEIDDTKLKINNNIQPKP